MKKLWKQYLKDFYDLNPSNEEDYSAGRIEPNGPPVEVDPNDCEYYFKQKGPLLENIGGVTGFNYEWEQTNGYNADCPDLGCSSNFDQRAKVGCVPVAFGMYMRLLEHPDAYNWSAMDIDFPTSEAADLLYDLGRDLNTDYGCSSSSTNTWLRGENTFENFGYSGATYTDFSHANVVIDVSSGRPTLLRGCKEKNFFGITSGCHVWLCDGYQEWNNCDLPGYLYFKLHMKWGWGGSRDGWFSTGTWNPVDDSYKYGKKMIHNAKPNS